jgi:hypothetical protein
MDKYINIDIRVLLIMLVILSFMIRHMLFFQKRNEECDVNVDEGYDMNVDEEYS